MCWTINHIICPQNLLFVKLSVVFFPSWNSFNAPFLALPMQEVVQQSSKGMKICEFYCTYLIKLYLGFISSEKVGCWYFGYRYHKTRWKLFITNGWGFSKSIESYSSKRQLKFEDFNSHNDLYLCFRQFDNSK